MVEVNAGSAPDIADDNFYYRINVCSCILTQFDFWVYLILTLAWAVKNSARGRTETSAKISIIAYLIVLCA